MRRASCRRTIDRGADAETKPRRMIMRVWICCLAAMLFVCTALASADDPTTAREMIEAYQKTVGQMTAFHIEAVAKEWDKKATQQNPDGVKDGFSRSQHYTIVHRDSRWRLASTYRRGAPRER